MKRGAEIIDILAHLAVKYVTFDILKNRLSRPVADKASSGSGGGGAIRHPPNPAMAPHPVKQSGQKLSLI